MQVIKFSLSPLTPKVCVISFHYLIPKFLTAARAYAVTVVVFFLFHRFGKRPHTKVMFVVPKYIFVIPFLVRCIGCTVPQTWSRYDILPLYSNSIWRKQLWDRYYTTTPPLLEQSEKRSKRLPKKSQIMRYTNASG